MKYLNFLSITTFRNASKAIIILIVGLFLTIANAIYTERNVEVQSKKEFSFVCNELKEIIDQRLHTHALLLRSGSSLFAASDTVTRNQWKTFIEHNELKINIPGIQGVGVSIIIQKDQLKHHIQTIRNEGFSDYTVKPSGERDFYTSIIFLEPFADTIMWLRFQEK
jgi:CHASE1-domain containing sensor protein